MYNGWGAVKPNQSKSNQIHILLKLVRDLFSTDWSVESVIATKDEISKWKF